MVFTYTDLNYGTPPYYGRRVMYSSLAPDELTPTNLKTALEEALAIHRLNHTEIVQLHQVFRGYQPILEKEKTVRSDINYKIVDNTALYIVKFLTGYVFGDPIQYVSRGDRDSSGGELSILNNYMAYEDKAALDRDMAQWQYICGTAYRMALADPDAGQDPDEAPFEIYSIDPTDAFVVYSSDIGHKPLFGATMAYLTNPISQQVEMKIRVYTATHTYLFEGDLMALTYVQNTESEIHNYGMVPLIEYPLNAERIGRIEIVQTQLDALNNLISLALDDVEQFVQSLMVFTNVEIDPTDFINMVTLGAVKVKTLDPALQPKVELLTNNMQYSDLLKLAQYTYEHVLTVTGLPTSDSVGNGGNTGEAVRLVEGWERTEASAKQDEVMFARSERKFIKLILNICRNVRESEVRNLRLTDVDIKFSRNRSSNLLVKTQALQNLYAIKLPKEVAAQTVGLFSDSNDVANKWNAEEKRMRDEAEAQAVRMSQLSQTDNNDDDG